MFGLFDFNYDGKVTAGEFAMGMCIIDDLTRDEEYDTDNMVSEEGYDSEMEDED